eukprot:1287273-Amphidinium_carterae.1
MKSYRLHAHNTSSKDYTLRTSSKLQWRLSCSQCEHGASDANKNMVQEGSSYQQKTWRLHYITLHWLKLSAEHDTHTDVIC